MLAFSGPFACVTVMVAGMGDGNLAACAAAAIAANAVAGGGVSLKPLSLCRLFLSVPSGNDAVISSALRGVALRVESLVYH